MRVLLNYKTAARHFDLLMAENWQKRRVVTNLAGAHEPDIRRR